jgi:hypothetical protein
MLVNQTENYGTPFLSVKVEILYNLFIYSKISVMFVIRFSRYVDLDL